jgi:hypothetical protein
MLSHVYFTIAWRAANHPYIWLTDMVDRYRSSVIPMAGVEVS